MEIYRRSTPRGGAIRTWALALATVLGVGFSQAPLLAPTVAYAQAAQGLEAVLTRSPIARLLFLRTAEGRKLSRAIVGRPLANERELKGLYLRLRNPQVSEQARSLESEIERRLLAADLAWAEAGVEAPRVHGGAKLTGRQRELLETIARQELGSLDPASFGPVTVEFFPVQRAGAVAPAAAVPRKFDQIVPIEPNSLEAAFRANQGGRSFYERLVQLEDRYFRQRMLLFPDELAISISRAKGRPATPWDLLEKVAAERQSMSRELQELAQSMQAESPWFAESLRKSAEALSLDGARLARMREKQRTLSRTPYVAGHTYPELEGYTSLLRGEMGELRVALRLEGVQHRGVTVKGLLSRLGRENGVRVEAAIERIHAEHPHLLEKELDLVLNAGHVWAEVKYHRVPLTRAHKAWDSMVTQLELTQRIRRLILAEPEVLRALGMRPGRDIELRIYFVNGIEAGAATRLEELGYRVFGPRVQMPAAGGGSARDAAEEFLRGADAPPAPAIEAHSA